MVCCACSVPPVNMDAPSLYKKLVAAFSAKRDVIAAHFYAAHQNLQLSRAKKAYITPTGLLAFIDVQADVNTRKAMLEVFDNVQHQGCRVVPVVVNSKQTKAICARLPDDCDSAEKLSNEQWETLILAGVRCFDT